MDTEQIILGSGDLYMTAYYGTDLPEDSTLEVESNRVGAIQGGATLEYKPTEYEPKDDTGKVYERFVTSEETTLKSGVMTWNAETLKGLTARSTYTDDPTKKVRTLKIGGIGARPMAKNVVRFVHTKADGHKFRITIVGTASNGFSLAFAPDKETVIDAEFKALAHGADNTQVIISEEYGDPEVGG